MTPDEPGDDHFDMFEWKSDSLTWDSLIETGIHVMMEKISETIHFNNRDDAKFSNTQTLYVKRDNEYIILPTAQIQEGDILIRVLEDGTYAEELVETITNDTTPQMTYLVGCEPSDWFIAGGYLVHNK